MNVNNYARCCNSKYLMKICLLLLLNFSIVFNSFSQSGTITGNGTVLYNPDGSVTVKGLSVFTSHISQDSSDKDGMVGLDAISLFRLGVDMTGGIKSQVSPVGYVTLTVYSYKPTSQNKKGNILYRLKTTTTSTTQYIGTPENIPSPTGSGTIASDQIKILLRGADTYLVDPSRCNGSYSLDLYSTTMAYLNGQSDPLIPSPLYKCLEGNNYKLQQPVIIEVEVKDATVMAQGLKFPGMVEEYDLANYFDATRFLKVTVKVNGVEKQTYIAGDRNPPALSLVLGDEVTYDVQYNGQNTPQIEGASGVWIARFAGDLMYYCTPSLTPDGYNPWIGYDSRVHTLQMRNMDGDPNHSRRIPNWTKPQSNIWRWSWIAPRRMDAGKTKYEAAYTWPKYKTLSDGTKQRNNQREGLNIQFLNYWQQGINNSDFRTYQGQAKYMMGFDDDELLYLNSQDHDASIYPPKPGGGIVKLDVLPSRSMPEGPEQIYDVATGYPAQGFPLNIIVSAYQKNREWFIKGNGNYYKKYNGYEIQDNGTNNTNPLGNGTGNVTAPGSVYIRAGSQLVTIKMNVKAPLSQDKGMYGSLEGNLWPAYGETDMPYTMTGLQGLEISELDKFSMVYEGSDNMGNLISQTKNLKDLSSAEKNQIFTTGRWTAQFNNTTPNYSCITVYYRRELHSQNVIVAGKELKPIFLLFLGASNLEGKGLGLKIWLNDFRSMPSGGYSKPRTFGSKVKYMKPYCRIYTFPVGTNTSWEAWDGDPHLFYDSGTEWFLSSRTLALRIPDNYLDGTNPNSGGAFLKYYVDDVEIKTGRNGKNFDYTWNTPGTHKLRVEYRIDGGLTSYEHKINVVNYPNQTLGNIFISKLTQREVEFLNIPSSESDQFRIAEVQDVYSIYEYKDGPRANTPYENRWADFNDYASNYSNNINLNHYARTFISYYSDKNWFWNNWALHYSSNWRDHLPNGLPKYVPNNLVTRVTNYQLDNFDSQIRDLFNTVSEARWQYVVPLVSYTDYQGNRMRTNPSCLYDINTIWDNVYGAFSGIVTLPTNSDVFLAPDITDYDKDKQEFYYDLKSGKKILYKTTGNSYRLDVYNTDNSTNTRIASTIIN